MLTNANLATAVSEADRTFLVGPDTVSLVAMPLFHIGGVGWAMCGMSRGDVRSFFEKLIQWSCFDWSKWSESPRCSSYRQC